MAEVPFRPVRQLSEYKGKGASASREVPKYRTTITKTAFQKVGARQWNSKFVLRVSQRIICYVITVCTLITKIPFL